MKKLSELEEGARSEHEEQQRLDAEEQLGKQIAEAEAAEAFRHEVIAWMVQEGDLDADELRALLSVENHRTGVVRLRVPDHTDITFRVVLKDETYAVYNDTFEVERLENYARHVYGLGRALLAASEEWLERIQYETRKEQRDAELRAKHELRDREAAERGAKYLDLLDDHPILRPILHILGAFLEERERFAEDLYQAEEFYAGVEARYQESLEQAQYEARRAESQREDLQRDLWDVQDKLSDAERKSRRGR